MKKVVQYFIQGLVTAMPLFLTLYIFIKIFNSLGSILDSLGISINPYIDGVIGIVGVFTIIVLIGMLASSFLFQSIFLVVEKLVERSSFVKSVYHPIKDFVDAFIGNKKKFDKPVLVLINKETGNKQLGFITQTDLKDLEIGEGLISVYMPHSYAFSGILMIVPKENVTPVNASSGEVMKFIVSGGVITDHDTPVSSSKK